MKRKWAQRAADGNPTKPPGPLNHDFISESASEDITKYAAMV